MAGTASAAFLRLLAQACVATGVDAARVLRSCELDPAVLHEAEGTVPIARARQAWETAARLSGTDDFGLVAAERIPVGSFDLVEYAARSSTTWGEALRRVARYGPLLAEAGEFSLEETGELALFSHRAKGAVRHVSELMLATVVLRGRAITGVDFAPRSVTFMHGEPASLETHRRLFRAPLRFSQPADTLVFDRTLLEKKLLTAEPQLASVLERHAESLLAKLPPQGSLVAQVRRAMLAAMNEGEPRIEDVAQALAMTARTLQRRLAEESLTFQALLDELRQELAIHYLGEQKKPAAEVAFLLGFADASAFRKAFKRWTGESPGEFVESRQRAG